MEMLVVHSRTDNIKFIEKQVNVAKGIHKCYDEEKNGFWCVLINRVKIKHSGSTLITLSLQEQ